MQPNKFFFYFCLAFYWGISFFLFEKRWMNLKFQIKSTQEENSAQADHVDRLTFQAVDKVLSGRLKEMEQQYECLQEEVEIAHNEISVKK